ncbi:MAG: hypothetical protein WCT27_05155 [Patescibacteria group bacterium]
MEVGTYKLVSWTADNRIVTISTDAGPLTVTKEQVTTHSVVLMPSDQEHSVIVDANGATIVSHLGDLSGMRFGLGLPTD